MICCLHHKRLRETESTTRYHSPISISFNPLLDKHFASSAHDSVLGDIYLYTFSLESCVDCLVHIRQRSARSLKKTAVLSHKSTATSPTSRCRQSHTEAAFLGCSLSFLRSVDPKTPHAKFTRSLSEWQCQSLSAGA